MNKKVIRDKIRGKINDWINTIEDKELKNEVKDKIIVTGGAIVSMLLNEEIKDYDIYFTEKEITKKVAKYYKDQYQKNNSKLNDDIKLLDVCEKILEEKSSKEKEEKKQYRPVFLSENAITLTNKIQLIVRFYGDSEIIYSNFDFVHCTNYWTSKDNKLCLNADALEAILSKTLYYVGSKYPICSMIRTRKFLRRGWHINAGQYLKIAFQISELDLLDIKIMKDQLIGVDSTYFNILIEALKNKLKDSEFDITQDYVVSIIDKIF